MSIEESSTAISGDTVVNDSSGDNSKDQESLKSNNEPSKPTVMQPRLRVHTEDSVAYITVSDPTEYNEGIRGKYTMYSVAYDPPLPTAGDAGGTNSNGSSNSKALFPYATSVNRRYSDFAWLYDHLHKERPGAIVPPLPEKQQVSRFSDSFIEDRRFHLEIFLRRVVCNEELKDTECLLVFLGGGDAEFKKAKKDGSFGNKSHNIDDDYNNMTDGMETNEHNHLHQAGNHSTLVDKSKDKLSSKKQGIKKWLKEKKTTYTGSLIRSPDDAVFDQITHYINALEAGLKRVEAEATASVKRDKEVASSMLEFGLGCDAIAHVDDEINGSGVGEESKSSGTGQTFRLIGKTADEISAISSEHYERELAAFQEPLRDHLKMIHAVKIALSKRNNRRITYSTCLNAVDSKKASLHKHRINQESNKVLGVESSLSRAETNVIVAEANYKEVSERVLREVDRFRKENAVAMYATMADFAKMQKEYHNKMNDAWSAVLPQIESCDSTKLNGSSFSQAAAELREGKSNGIVLAGTQSVEVVTNQVDSMSMPSYPPPPEPSANGMESSMLNGAVRYRELPEAASP